MKKIKYLLVALLVGVLLTGCGKGKVVKCTNTINQDGIEYTATYEISLDSDDYVKKVETTEVLVSDDSSYLDATKQTTEELYSASNKAYGGYDYSVKVSGNKLTAKCTIDYSKMDVKKFVEDNPSLESFASSDNKVKLEGVKRIYEALGAKCE